MSKLTHFDEDGHPHMVDVSGKSETQRIAVASGAVLMSADAFDLAQDPNNKKGNALMVARLAGIMGTKRTSDLIPLCHPLPINGCEVDIQPMADRSGYKVEARVRTQGKTGVEMEALTAVSVACLTLYDMLKAVDKSMVITAIQLDEKTGGKSGDYKRQDRT